MSEQLDTFGIGARAYRIEPTEYESCPLECTDCGAYPMQAVYNWEMREIVCTKCSRCAEEDYLDPETVTQWEFEEEAERREKGESYDSSPVVIGTNTQQFPQCPINPQGYELR